MTKHTAVTAAPMIAAPCGCAFYYRENPMSPRFSPCPVHAAAPQLLATLKYAEQFGEAPLNYPVILKRIRAAIRQAEGRGE